MIDQRSYDNDIEGLFAYSESITWKAREDILMELTRQQHNLSRYTERGQAGYTLLDRSDQRS
jgi:hypothetical protein